MTSRDAQDMRDLLQFAAVMDGTIMFNGSLETYQALAVENQRVNVFIDLPFRIFLDDRFTVSFQDKEYGLTLRTILTRQAPSGLIATHDGQPLYLDARKGRTALFSHTQAVVGIQAPNIAGASIGNRDFLTQLLKEAIEVVNHAINIYTEVTLEHYIRPVVLDLDILEATIGFFDVSGSGQPIAQFHLLGGGQAVFTSPTDQPVRLNEPYVERIRARLATSQPHTLVKRLQLNARHQLANHDLALALIQGLTAVEVAATESLASAAYTTSTAAALRSAIENPADPQKRKDELAAAPLTTLEEIQNFIDVFVQKIERRVGKLRQSVGLEALSTNPLLFTKFMAAKAARNSAAHAARLPTASEVAAHLDTFEEVVIFLG
ncbi:hypothetical protein ACFFLM_19070 [Deinococcus oregonensis]|uniref:Uncharacterized protein n=1 Tax=Deinococcus oregonensis TaxID=1805970 RepID=A0ABV6B2S1_9DEIO